MRSPVECDARFVALMGMKLRIRGNSVRIRVTQSELDRVAGTGEVNDTVHFGQGAQLTYRLVVADAGKVTAAFDGTALTVRVPAAVIGDWARTDIVSITGEQALDGGETLRILVEKDFECLAPRDDEPPGDFFVNPAGSKAAD
jgi:hypothetical protein